MARLTTHDGKSGPRDPVERVQCPKCNGRLGVEVRAELIEVWIAPDLTEDGKLVGGHKVWVCRRCLARDEWSPFGPSG